MRPERFTEAGNATDRRGGKRRLSAFLMAVGAVLWLTACFKADTQVAGGGTGSEAGDAYGRLHGDATLGSGLARVTLYRAADSLGGVPEVVAAVRADSLGQYRFRAPAPGNYDIEFRGNSCECGSRDYGHGLLYRRGVTLTGRGEADLGTDSLDREGSHKGKVDRRHAGRSMRLAMTPYSAAIDTAGSFAFPSVPKGTYALLIEGTTADSAHRLATITVSPGAEGNMDYRTAPDTVPVDTTKVPDTTTVTEAATVYLVDDFSDLDQVSNLGKAYGGGQWSIDQTGGTPLIYLAESNGAWQGRSLRVTFIGADTGNVVASLPLGSGTPDLSKADSVSFMVKGMGGRIFLTVLWNNSAGSISSIGHWVNLTGNWTEMRLPVRIPGAASTTSLNRFEFKAPSGTEFWLDDLRISGRGLLK